MSLKDILDSEEMSQKDLCLRTDMSEKHISNIIQGKASITPETALKLEKVFGLKIIISLFFVIIILYYFRESRYREENIHCN